MFNVEYNLNIIFTNSKSEFRFHLLGKKETSVSGQKIGDIKYQLLQSRNTVIIYICLTKDACLWTLEALKRVVEGGDGVNVMK